MSVLSGKKIVLGISGGIAAYKTASLVRLFIKAGAHVQVIMTPASKDFITPLTLSTLSKRPVFSSFYKEEEELISQRNGGNQCLPISSTSLNRVGVCGNGFFPFKPLL